VKRDDQATLWKKPLEIKARAMLLAGKVLFIAGPQAEAAFGLAEDVGDQEALLLAISAVDGTELARHRLDCSPIFDGMAAANGRLYLSLENGRVVCFGEE
jgi:hypothetical protein